MMCREFIKLGEFGFVAAFSLLIVCVSPSCAAQDVKVTAYRPTVSNSAALSEPGWLEIENGFAVQHERDGSRQSTMPYLVKFALSQDFGILLGGDGYVSQVVSDGTRSSGHGDTTLLFKHRKVLDEAVGNALGLEYGFKAPTATTGLGSGEYDWLLNGIYSDYFSGHSFDVNLNVTKLGETFATESAYQYGWAASVFRPMGEKLGVMAELSGSMRRGTTPLNQWLLAASYEWSSRLVIDAGLSAGISCASPRFTLFTGVAVLLGKVR